MRGLKQANKASSMEQSFRMDVPVNRGSVAIRRMIYKKFYFEKDAFNFLAYSYLRRLKTLSEGKNQPLPRD